MPDILITIPKSVDWSVYQLELDAAAAGSTMNFKVPNFPKVNPGDRCYVVYNGFVRGWMQVTGLKHDDFVCDTTGDRWSGKFVQRSGHFHPVKHEQVTGFQGFRYVDRTRFEDA